MKSLLSKVIINGSARNPWEVSVWNFSELILQQQKSVLLEILRHVD